MVRYRLGLAAALIILAASQALGNGFMFTEPGGYYQTVIPEQWVYQTHQSDNHLVVFYGPDESNLLYIERLQHILDDNARSFAERTLNLYEAPGGLRGFQLEEPVTELMIDGVAAASSVYSYLLDSKARQWEYRIFIVLEDEQGIVITISDSEDSFEDSCAVFQTVISNWRWSQ